MEFKVGQAIKIIQMNGESDYDGRSGIIKHIDDIGQLHGTWGGLAANPEVDNVLLVEHFVCSICGKEVIGFSNNAYPINNGRCCNKCNDYVIFERIKRVYNKKGN